MQAWPSYVKVNDPRIGSEALNTAEIVAWLPLGYLVEPSHVPVRSGPEESGVIDSAINWFARHELYPQYPRPITSTDADTALKIAITISRFLLEPSFPAGGGGGGPGLGPSTPRSGTGIRLHIFGTERTEYSDVTKSRSRSNE